MVSVKRFREFERVMLPEGKGEGYVLADDKDAEGYRFVKVMGDDYVIYIVDPERLTALVRDAEKTEPFKPHANYTRDVRLYEVESNRAIWYSMAIRHSFWDKQLETHPDRTPLGVKAYAEYWEFYQSGTRANMPPEQDIRIINVPVKQGVLLD